jgi:uncharacterized protein (DUF305 family)
MKRLFGVIALSLVAALTLAGCGGSTASSSGSSSSSSEFNDADVTFAQSMIPHHQQAVQMSEIARMHASTTQVKQLADNIEAAQGPEIDTMTGWLKAWGEDVPSDSDSDMGGMGGMDGSDHSMGGEPGGVPGMMSDADMKALDAATGAEFDRMFLTMMIDHHAGAIAMAKTEQADGTNPDAIALAKKIQAAQAAEIAQMKDMLKS